MMAAAICLMVCISFHLGWWASYASKYKNGVSGITLIITGIAGVMALGRLIVSAFDKE